MALRRLAQAFNRALRPFPALPLLPGHCFSELDGQAERDGLGLVSAFFAQSPAGPKLERALERYFDDPQAGLALRKDLHRVFEQRLRACALTLQPAKPQFGKVDPGKLGHHIDGWAMAEMAGRAGRAPAPTPETGKTAWISLAAWAGALLGASLALPIRRGCWRPQPIRAEICAPNIMQPPFWAAFKAACAELGRWSPATLAVIREFDGPDLRVEREVKATSLRLPLAKWLRRVALPVLPLILRVMGVAALHGRDPRALEACARTLNIAATSLTILPVAANLQCRWMLDIADYSVQHVIKAILYRRQGIRMVRFPFSETENPGYSYAHCDYAVAFSGAGHLVRAYGRSWAPGVESVPVGLFRNDRHQVAAAYDAGPPEPWQAEIEARLAQGQKMIGFFGCNDMEGHKEASLLLFETLWRALGDAPGWFIAIKPKKLRGAGGFLDSLCEAPEMAAALDSGRVVTAGFPDSERLFPARWFIERMSFGLTTPSSVQAEALALGVPMPSYFPFIQDTAATRALRSHGLCFDDEHALGRALGEAISGKAPFTVPMDWVRAEIDPWGDDRAMTRILERLFKDPSP